MDQKTKQTATERDFSDGWSQDDRAQIANVVFPILEMQKAFGRKFDTELVMKGWQAKLSKRFTANQVLYALDQYTDQHDDFPTPANIIAILNPAPVLISDAEYVQACRFQERNGFNPFSDAADVIREYKKQSHEQRENYKIQCENIKQIVLHSVKKIST